MENDVKECAVGGHADGVGFGELAQAMTDDLYWIRFFVRPCCPAPDLEGAKDMLDKLAGEVEARADFTADEKRELVGLIEARKQWYPTSGLCRGSRTGAER